MSAVEAGRPAVPPGARLAAATAPSPTALPNTRAPSTSSNGYLLVPIFSLFVLLIVAVARSPNLISSAGIGSAIIVAAPLILATYALTPIAMAGRGGVDLSVGPLLGFINVTLIQLFGAGILETPIEFFAYAIGAGVAYQIVMGLIIVYVRVQPIIVSLAGYLALAGLNLVILARTGGVAPDWMMDWGLGTSIFSPVLVILVLATVAWLILSRTAFFGHLRLMGADERAAYTSGVRIGIVRIGAHIIAGVYVGLAALALTGLISSGDPTQGSTYTLMAVTALVLGGTSLAGGRGGAVGSLLGAVNVYLITYVLATFNFGMVQSFVTRFAYGVILVLSLLLSLILPQLQARIRNLSPLLFFLVLGLAASAVVIHARFDYVQPASVSGASTEPAVKAADEKSTNVFLFEDKTELAAPDEPVFAKQLAYAALLALSLLVLLRVTIFQAGAKNIATPVFIVVAAVTLLGAYLVAKDRAARPPSPPAPASVPVGAAVPATAPTAAPVAAPTETK